MKAKKTFEFSLDRWTPGTLPMARLGQYLEKLAALAGSKESVHFESITKGSAVQKFYSDEVAAEAVSKRMWLVGSPDAPADIVKTQQELNRMLQEDGCVATLKVHGGGIIYKFPGRKTPILEEVTVHEFGEVTGELIRVGGKDGSVPVWLQASDGTIYRCTTNKNVARDLARLLFGPQVRVSGNGKWRRSADRKWHMEEFIIKSWETVEQDDLEATVAALRAVEGSGWNAMKDPHAELRKLRGDE
ncbi:MFS transporter [Noviherbaspirillum malthae]|jgi:hypothetical protein|uniref:MFS transporter n=1 Tax=Noviherbaspirillum malthae TaxID=1260987 RepID=UPI0018905DF8|nr:MFS transporter [Noviherbaspirillum malthae]